MKNALKSMVCHRTSSANVVDGKLILSFPDAKTPVVWQMDLNQTKASALEVCENTATNTYAITLKTPKSEGVEIATFDKKEVAIDGLMCTFKALESAHGQIRGGASDAAGATVKYKRPSQRWKWGSTVMALLVLFVLFTLWGTAKSLGPGGLVEASLPDSAPPGNSVGVPVSAEDFLKEK